jgi:hypothetical protein
MLGWLIPCISQILSGQGPLSRAARILIGPADQTDERDCGDA